jgi:aldehyde dehydrogenase (NAD+)
MGKMINNFHLERVQKLIETSGGKTLLGGSSVPDMKYIEPTVILEPKMDSGLMQEEIFGPVMPIIPIQSISHAIDIINSKPKPLAVYYFGDASKANCHRLSAETSSGAFVSNECMLQIVSNY